MCPRARSAPPLEGYLVLGAGRAGPPLGCSATPAGEHVTRGTGPSEAATRPPGRRRLAPLPPPPARGFPLPGRYAGGRGWATVAVKVAHQLGARMASHG